MELIVLVTLLVVVEYFYLTLMVGKCRSETGISAPAIIGDEKFERVFRARLQVPTGSAPYQVKLQKLGHRADSGVAGAVDRRGRFGLTHCRAVRTCQQDQKE